MQSGFSPLFFIGVIENNVDARLEGRVQVRAFGYHGTVDDIPTEDLPWATLIYGDHTLDSRVPPLNAWVFGFFLDGREAQQPMILGVIPTQMTEIIDPKKNGWGVVPTANFDRLGRGSRPRDMGEPAQSALARAETLARTYNSALEANRALAIPIAGGCARGLSRGNSNLWSGDDTSETSDSGGAGGTGVVSSRPAGGNIPVSERDAIRQYYDYMRSIGLTHEQAVGALANIERESRFRPDAINPSGEYSLGLFQFNQGVNRNQERGLRFEREVPDWRTNPLAQIQYMMTRDQAGKIYASRTFSNALDAANYFTEKVEIPAKSVRDTEIAGGGNASRVQRIEQVLRETASQSTDSTILSTSGSNSVVSRIDEIRKRLQEIEQELLQATSQGNLEQILELTEEKKTLEEELKQLTDQLEQPNTNNTYAGYQDHQASGSNDDPGCRSTWEEPASAYSTIYPFNRVIETAAGHSVELDDTPGGERIMIWHRNGAYIQIANDTMTIKTTGDSYHITEGNHHQLSRGQMFVTIEGDCHTLVKGNKVEEIMGDYVQIVHGNSSLGSGGRFDFTGADFIGMRAAALSLESNVEDLNIKTGKNISFESGETINFISDTINLQSRQNMSLLSENAMFIQATDSVHVKTDGSIHANPAQNLYLLADGGTISMQSGGSFRVKSDQFVSIESGSIMSFLSNKNMMIESKKSLDVNAKDILSLFSESPAFIRSDQHISIQTKTNLNLYGDAKIYVQSNGGIDLLSDDIIKITGDIVYIDDIVRLAEDVPASETSDPLEKEPVRAPNFGGEFDTGQVAQPANPALPPRDPSSGAVPPSPPPAKVLPVNLWSYESPSEPVDPNKNLFTA